MEEGKQYQYQIVLSAPVGEKKGTLFAEISEEKVSGMIHIMGHDNPFCGTIDGFGNCSISGTLKILIGHKPYHASGFLEEDKTMIYFETRHGKMVLTGTAVKLGGKDT